MNHGHSPGYSLVDETWVPVLDLAGRQREVSLRELFAEAHQLRKIVCELPTQTFAVLRLALAILHRAMSGPSESTWRSLWRSTTLPDEPVEYLDEFLDRFDLLHPERPFYQVAGLRTARGDVFGLERIVADVPNGIPYLTSRAGPGMQKVSPAEAALWVVHCQAFDTAGIKSGAEGDDDRVKGGRGYPQGVASAGGLGGVYVEGQTLRETLLLNLVPIDVGLWQSDERDLPVWEREPPHGPTEEPKESRGPFGVLSLYTWQSRRLRLYGDRDGITGAMVSYGDILDWQDKHRLEPLSVWVRSTAREKQQKRVVYMPRPHDPTRALWRGLATLLPQPSSGDGAPSRFSPVIMQWLARVSRIHIAARDDFMVHPRAVSVVYGSNQSIVDRIFDDAVTMNVHVVPEDSSLRTCVVDATADAEGAVNALRALAKDLVRAAAGSGVDNGAADRAAEAAYAQLDQRFRGWLARLSPDSDQFEQKVVWQQAVSWTVARLGRDLITSAGPTAWIGRTVKDRTGKEVHYSSSQAEAWFRTRLRKALPLAGADGPKKTLEEVPA